MWFSVFDYFNSKSSVYMPSAYNTFVLKFTHCSLYLVSTHEHLGVRFPFCTVSLPELKPRPERWRRGYRGWVVEPWMEDNDAESRWNAHIWNPIGCIMLIGRPTNQSQRLNQTTSPGSTNTILALAISVGNVSATYVSVSSVCHSVLNETDRYLIKNTVCVCVWYYWTTVNCAN